MKQTVEKKNNNFFIIDSEGALVFERLNDQEAKCLGYISEQDFLAGISSLVTASTPMMPRGPGGGVAIYKSNIGRGGHKVHHMLMEYVRPEITINLTGNGHVLQPDGSMKIEKNHRLTLKMPCLYFGVSVKETQGNLIPVNNLYCLASSRRITTTHDILMLPVLPNVGDRGAVCVGSMSNRDKTPIEDLNMAVHRIITTFLDSEFNDHLRKTYETNLLHPAYQKLMENSRLYSNDYLISAALMSQQDELFLSSKAMLEQCTRRYGGGTTTVGQVMQNLEAYNV